MQAKSQRTITTGQSRSSEVLKNISIYTSAGKWHENSRSANGFCSPSFSTPTRLDFFSNTAGIFYLQQQASYWCRQSGLDRFALDSTIIPFTSVECFRVAVVSSILCISDLWRAKNLRECRKIFSEAEILSSSAPISYKSSRFVVMFTSSSAVPQSESVVDVEELTAHSYSLHCIQDGCGWDYKITLLETRLTCFSFNFSSSIYWISKIRVWFMGYNLFGLDRV